MMAVQHYVHLWLAGTLCAVATSTVQSAPVERDFRSFEDGGTIEFAPRDDSPNSGPSAKVREFLWAHWITKRRGMIREVGYTIEGASSERTFFVEPDDQGNWRVAVEQKYQLLKIPNEGAEEKASYKTSSCEAYSVKRVKPGRGELALRPEIPERARVSVRSYRLVLFDRAGKMISEL